MSPSSMLILALLACPAYASTKSSSSFFNSQAAAKAMEKVFARSERAHSMSMALIMKGMSSKKAWDLLAKNNLTNPTLLELKNSVHGEQSFLHRTTPKKGYGGVEGARKLLNSMILDSQKEYDAKIIECTDFYASHCSAMEIARGEIAASNYEAANSRELILDAQDTINLCQVDIPTAKNALDDHNTKCANDLKRMRDEVKVVEADIKVVTAILKMTDCNKKSSFVDMNKLAVLRCEDQCTKKSFVTFNAEHLHKVISQLQSSVGQKLMHDSFADLFNGIQSMEAGEFMQVDNGNYTINVTKFNNPPTPRTDIPPNPCNDPLAGAPSTKKRSNKCSIGASPKCHKLQERFLLIQSGISDTRKAMLEDISSMETHCKETKATLEKQIKDDEQILNAANTKLGMATGKEADAAEMARVTAEDNDELDGQLKKKMKSCSESYIGLESEICALKKIRGELYKMQKTGYKARVFVDCEVSKWDPEECSRTCQRKNEPQGTQKLLRSILTHPDGGSKCLPLSAVRKCNLQPCPINCDVSIFSGWSKCSAECGGGVQQRLKTVRRAARYGGEECGQTSEARSCNAQACEADCDLSSWTRWSWCSKDCDGGTRKRTKHITHAPKGEGKCPLKNATQRLQYKPCNKFACLTELSGDCSTFLFDTKHYTCDTLPACCGGYTGLGISDTSVQCKPVSYQTDSMYKTKCGLRSNIKKCRQELDIVVLLDGSGSLGRKGWDAEIKAAKLFVDAFAVSGAKAQIATILYSGPWNWYAYWRCSGYYGGTVNYERDCKIKTVNHFESNMATVRTNIGKLTWPAGTTFTSGALLRAKAELSLGRTDARSIIVCITDGRPISFWSTWAASWSVRRAARLVWVAVTKWAPLRWIKWWATHRWQENVVLVKGFKDLDKPHIINQLIADICPAPHSFELM